jgi:hypothetical protein
MINDLKRENHILKKYIKNKHNEDPEMIIQKELVHKDRKAINRATYILVLLITISYIVYFAVSKVRHIENTFLEDSFQYFVNVSTLVALIALLQDRKNKT